MVAYSKSTINDDNEDFEDKPYIAAKFLKQSIPYNFVLGDGLNYEGFINRKLKPDTYYKVFVRAYVNVPQKHLYTSSPFSPELNLNMMPEPAGPTPKRPTPGGPDDRDGSYNGRAQHKSGSMVWVVGPVLAAILFAFIIIFIFVMRKRRQNTKQPLEQGAVLTPLMSGFEMNNAQVVAAGGNQHHANGNNGTLDGTLPVMMDVGPGVSDPVELRRLNFQTPGMMSHPPIPIMDLAAHIEDLKAEDNLKFSAEYESIEPGQQFTWDNSSMDCNKHKNRYANVIAYDHSRVVLQPVDGVPGSDYINGNYCDGYRKANAYIATQGPLQETIADFWRMVWEQRSSTIVMLTRLEERSRIKCDQYWPSRGTESYGVMSVTLTDIQELATYVIRTFQLQRVSSLNVSIPFLKIHYTTL